MTAPSPKPRPRPRHAAPEKETEKPAPVEKPRCNVPGCDDAPEFRGLCSAHRQTHRGLLDPKGKR